MKSILKLVCLAAVAFPAALPAQLVVDRQKYPDYDPTVRPDRSLMRYGSRARLKGAAVPAESQRPDHVNNAATMYFPPIISQEGGSCGSASRIAYMFTHELNSFRHTNASLPENMYPTHFVWLLTYGNSGKDQFVQHVGVPSVKTYGGRGNSALFGYKEWDSQDYGWMTGYEKWHEAMFNRMLPPRNLPMGVGTEEGRNMLKNWLWNHNGDTDFACGGIAGIGVASAAAQGGIPRTDANVAAGVVGQSYVRWWGTSVDHALTVVGYDDRIEFDLDGNGKAGEKEKDEVGAWIIANSWGGWANNGLIYCPYAYGFPAHSVTKEGGKEVRKQSGGWWQPELYYVRKNYRPLRTIKVKMDYSHRSEMLLTVGVATDPNATRPEKTIDLHHFRWAGDGHNGDMNPAPAVPMLGRWADGKLHNEPMEFGYDLTDLCEGLDHSKPLKFFFNVDARTKSKVASRAKGSGHIYNVSIIDYEFDKEGVETPLELEAENGVLDVPGGKITTVSGVVYGEQYTMPRNLQLKGTQLTWDAPQACGHNVKAYNIYKDGVKISDTEKREQTIDGSGTYSVSALFDSGVESQRLTVSTPIAVQTPNVAAKFNNNGFNIPDIFNDTYGNCTIEFWVKPQSLKNWNLQAGRWGQFMFHANEDGEFTAGWDAVGEKRVHAYGALKVGRWNHIAMVVNKGSFNVYVDGKSAGSVNGGSTFSGIGGFGTLNFWSGEANGQDAVYDEIRIWNKSRTRYEIQQAMNTEFSGSVLPQGLIAYYKGNVMMIDGKPYLQDCVGAHNAPIVNPDNKSYEEINSDKTWNTEVKGTISINNTRITGPAKVVAGQPAAFSAVFPDAVEQLSWNAPDAGIENYSGAELTAIFPKVGNYEVNLTAKGTTEENQITVKRMIEVTPAAEFSADFKASLKQVPAGQRVSFIPTQPVAGYRYEWTMEGGDVTSSKAISAATTFQTVGKHQVTLKVTSAAGEVKTQTQTIEVAEVSPEADFNVLTPVVTVNDTVKIKDESKFTPTSWKWMLSSPGKNYLVNGRNVKFQATEPGVYDVVLTASNNVGTSTLSRSRGLIVVNADSKSGLSFNSASSRVVLSKSPLAEADKNFTVEWWMNPSKLSDFCCGIGNSDDNFLIKADAAGALIVSKGGRQMKSNNDLVVPGEWHHYAVVVNSNNVIIYRDGHKVASQYVLNAVKGLNSFSIGTAAADMNGQIDEFRVWGSALSQEQLQTWGNAPLNVNAEDVKAADLRVYYDFNQNSGNVQDRGANANHATRLGFGPDGDAWPLSKGVFSLNFSAKGKENVTKDYLANTKTQFRHTTVQMNDTKSGRWYELKDWKLENQVKNGNVTTAACYDGYKNGNFTVATGWDGFADLKDHKVYQVVKLPAGLYSLTVTYGQHDQSAGSYLAVAAGNKLPDTENLSTAIASQAMEGKGNGGTNTLHFTLDKETEVAIGMVVNMTGQRIFCISDFMLTKGAFEELEGVAKLTGILAPQRANAAQGTIFDLSGRRVFETRPGNIYIENGQRVVK